jgi:DNA-binding MarR family transcriptional regulator
METKLTQTMRIVKGWTSCSAAQKLMAVVLADYADRGEDTPRITDLAEAMQTGGINVMRNLRILREAGFITWTRVQVGPQTRRNKYELLYLQ